MSNDKPNILFIVSDQHSPFVTGCYGNPNVRTPNLDALAKEGVLFESAYCAAPICVPSRLSMLSGRYPHNIGVWSLSDTIRSDTPTFPVPLTIAGWHTLICGRMHLVWGDRNHGFESRLCGDRFPTMQNHFAHWNHDEVPATKAGLAVCEAGVGSSRHDAEDAIAEGHALKYLHETNHAERERPFAMCLGFYRPHSPYMASQDLVDLYTKLNPSVGHTISVRPDFYRSLSKHFGLDDRPPTDEEAKRAIRCYYAMVTGLDRRIGTVCQALKQQGLWDDTIVIYTSDHGESLGNHGLWFKSNFYEESARVPLIVRYPKKFASDKRVKEPVSLLDLFPTFCEIAGTKPYPFLDGKSLMPALTGGELDPNRSVFAEYADYGIHVPMRMIRIGKYKLMYAEGYDPALFDLENDPNENNNLVGKPEFTNTAADLLMEITKDWKPDPVRKRVQENQRNRDLFIAAEKAIKKATGKQGFPWGPMD